MQNKMRENRPTGEAVEAVSPQRNGRLVLGLGDRVGRPEGRDRGDVEERIEA